MNEMGEKIDIFSGNEIPSLQPDLERAEIVQNDEYVEAGRKEDIHPSLRHALNVAFGDYKKNGHQFLSSTDLLIEALEAVKEYVEFRLKEESKHHEGELHRAADIRFVREVIDILSTPDMAPEDAIGRFGEALQLHGKKLE